MPQQQLSSRQQAGPSPMPRVPFSTDCSGTAVPHCILFAEASLCRCLFAQPCSSHKPWNRIEQKYYFDEYKMIKADCKIDYGQSLLNGQSPFWNLFLQAECPVQACKKYEQNEQCCKKITCLSRNKYQYQYQNHLHLKSTNMLHN